VAEFPQFLAGKDRWIPAFAGMTDRRGQREFETAFAVVGSALDPVSHEPVQVPSFRRKPESTTIGARLGSIPSLVPQRLFNVFNQVVDVFNSDAQPHQGLCDSTGFP